MFYKILLQSVLSFGLFCVFGNMHVKDQKKLLLMIKMASKIIGLYQVSTAQLYNELTFGKRLIKSLITSLTLSINIYEK